MDQKVLITGGGGFIGKHLQKTLRNSGFQVAILSRKKSQPPDIFNWDVDKQEIDLKAFDGTGTIIHLAGEGIADKRWTTKRKQEIMRSRVQTAELLYDKISTLSDKSGITGHGVKTFISASAVGIYKDRGEEWIDENSEHDSGFLGNTCEQWELAVRKMELLGIRVVVLRIGIILGKDGGALPVIAKPVKLFAGAPLGSGRQYMSWIHLDDLCNLFLQSIYKESMQGVYNAVAPNPVTNKQFTITLGKVLHRPIWPFSVPAFLLKLLLGEKASIVLDGQRVANGKVLSEGFKFRFRELEDALRDIY